MRKIYTAKIFMLSAFAGASLSLSSQVGTFRTDGTNARIVCSGAPFIVLSNMSFENNAHSSMLTAANSEFRFVGNAATVNIKSVGGPFNTTFFNVRINKSAGEISVNNNATTIITSGTLEMLSGNVNMGGSLATWQLGTSITSLGTLTRTAVTGGYFYNGFFRRWYSTGGSGTDVDQWDIPVGRSSGYNYARVYTTTGTGGSLRSRFVEVNPMWGNLPLWDATNTGTCGSVYINNCANEGYWEINAENGILSTFDYTIKLNYSGFASMTSEECVRVIKSENGSTWMQEGTHGTYDAGNDWITRTGQTGFSFFNIGGANVPNPLPVELAAFNANCGSNTIMINWSTASETANDYFVLERSKDLITWDLVATINSLNGNSNTIQQYSYEDNVYGGTFYYRLTQVDFDGTSKTYPPVSITCSDAGSDPSIVNLYQNGEGQITIVLFAPAEMDYLLLLYDLHGKAISISNGMLTGGNNTFTLDAYLLRDALYLVNVKLGNKSLSRKIFVK